ncbi:MAG: type II toxin-antitoxin system RelE/ParE family toxin [Bacteroidales bacterium]
MSFDVVATESFERKIKRLAKKYRSIKSDLLPIIDELCEQPRLGISIGKDCYKIRVTISSKGRGKSGGAHLIIFVRITKETVYLLDIYDKSEQETITDKEIEILIGLLSGD